MSNNQITRAVEALKNGDLVVIRTDTVYGIIASATNQEAIDKLYLAKKRNRQKACIVLLTNVDNLPGMTEVNKNTYRQLNQQRPTTISLPVATNYLSNAPRVGGTLAFRVVPQSSDLASIIEQVGPVLAPSANPEGMPTASNIAQAKDYFGDLVAEYVDSGEVIDIAPSRIIELQGEQIKIIRN